MLNMPLFVCGLSFTTEGDINIYVTIFHIIPVVLSHSSKYVPLIGKLTVYGVRVCSGILLITSDTLHNNLCNEKLLNDNSSVC